MSGYVFSQNVDSLKLKTFQSEIDNIEYSASDYNKIIKRYNTNKKLFEVISEKAINGEKSASDLLELLSLSYEDAQNKYGENYIKEFIYLNKKSNEIIEKFQKLDSTFQAENDSLKLKRDNFKKTLDSLKKN